jgi:2-methylisocitrate lyase-like PEP mutase family enzyme
MANINTQKEKARLFNELHYTGKMLVLPNIWDPLGAILLESLTYPAIATASASIAFTNGYNDGEKIPFNDLLTLLKKIVTSVNVPVTADIESGYADNNAQLQENIKLLIDAGIVGINIEDTDKKTNNLYPIEIQCNRIRLVRKVSDAIGVQIFINARTDVFLHGDFATPASKFDEILKRGLAYKETGADCFFPIALRELEDIQRLLTQLDMPINILIIPGIPDLKTLSKMGVARVSLGPSFLKIAIKAMKKLALELKDYEGLSPIIGNEITTDYLKSLVSKNY